MAEFFNKEYMHAYKRGNTVWVQGSIKEHPFHRMSTGKKISKSNINYIEKNWETIISDYFQSKLSAREREQRC